MKVLVTGANGYLGQGIVTAILDRNHEVVGTDLSTQYVDDRAQKIDCNIFDVENPYDFFGEPDILLHLAWRDGFKHYSNSHIVDLANHYKFLKEMIESGVKRIAVLGSMHEIGFFEGCINENTTCHPVTPYGITKRALRELVDSLTKKYDFEFQWLRGYYIVGNSKYGSSIFSKITALAELGEKELPFTMGQNQYDFIDYVDFCTYVAAAISQSEVTGIIEICSGYPEKLADRVERFIKENNYALNLKYGAFQDRPYDSKAIWGDNRKITRIMEANASSIIK